MQWLDIRLQMIGVTVVTGISVIAVIQHQMKSIDPGWYLFVTRMILRLGIALYQSNLTKSV